MTKSVPPIPSITYSRPRSRQRLPLVDYPGIMETISPLFIYLENNVKKLNDKYVALIRENPDQLLQKLQALQQKVYNVVEILQRIRLSSTLPYSLKVPKKIPQNIARPFHQLSSLFSHLDRTAHHEFFKKIRIQTEKIQREVHRLDDQIIHKMNQLQAPMSIARQQTTISRQQVPRRIQITQPSVQINQLLSGLPRPPRPRRSVAQSF